MPYQYSDRLKHLGAQSTPRKYQPTPLNQEKPALTLDTNWVGSILYAKF